MSHHLTLFREPTALIDVSRRRITSLPLSLTHPAADASIRRRSHSSPFPPLLTP